ncbi:MAG: hypothetical protein R6U21_08105 [Thermoplasmatota archaeon]
MRSWSITFGVMVVLSLLLSMTTIIPQTQSKPIMEKIELIEHNEAILGKLNDSASSAGITGFIEWIIEVITSLLEIITQIQLVVGLIMGIINSVKTLATAIPELFAMISDFITLLLNGWGNQNIVYS